MGRIEKVHAEWIERAAIAEYDGGLSRPEAETLATQRVALEYGEPMARAAAALARAESLRRGSG